ncbi:MAG: sigma-70 family RNA polymerase sigma factor [Acidobacteriota bacterium]
MIAETTDLTRELNRWCEGNRDGLDQVFEKALGNLKVIVGRALAGERERTLQTTELSNELYLELSDFSPQSFDSRRQFFKLAELKVGRLLRDRYRRRHAEIRGGKLRRVEIDAADQLADGRLSDELDISVRRAFEKLEQVDPRAHRISVLRYVCDLPYEMIAGEVGVAVSTVRRDWATAKLFLARELQIDRARRSGA